MQQDQGLKIAVICLTIVVLVLGVSVGLLLRGKKENDEKLSTAQKNAADKSADMKKWMTEAKELKKMVGGYVPEFPADDIVNKFAETIAPPEGKTARFAFVKNNKWEQNYEFVVGHLLTEIDKERIKIESETRDKQRAETELAAQRGLKEGKISEHKTAEISAKDGLKSSQQSYTDALEKANKENNEATSLLTQARAEADQTERDAEAAVSAAFQERDLSQTSAHNSTEKIQHMQRASVDIPSGKIMYVDQQARLVWLNIGSADGLEVRTVFSVFDPAICDVTVADRAQVRHVDNKIIEESVCEVCLRQQKLNVSKANIEVIEIKGPNSSVARILSDEVRNPISLSDVIFTPLWQPGQRQKYALVGNLHHEQFRSSGLADLAAVRQLIESTGGVVVAWVDENGKTQGQIDVETTYLVVGNTESLSEAEAQRVEEFRKLAKMNGTIEITLPSLLRRTGWVSIAPEANPESANGPFRKRTISN